jgi:Family of unknown function (DUF6496)
MNPSVNFLIKSPMNGTLVGAGLKICFMPDKTTIEKARQDKARGKSPGTQAGEFVHDEIKKIRKGKHGARSAKQAIAIGLSQARRAGVDLPPPKTGSKELKRKAKRDTEKGRSRAPISRKRSRARIKALKKEPTTSVSSAALSRQAHAAAKKRTKGERSAAARKAARTKGPRLRSLAAKKATRTRAK